MSSSFRTLSSNFLVCSSTTRTFHCDPRYVSMLSLHLIVIDGEGTYISSRRIANFAQYDCEISISIRSHSKYEDIPSLCACIMESAMLAAGHSCCFYAVVNVRAQSCDVFNPRGKKTRDGQRACVRVRVSIVLPCSLNSRFHSTCWHCGARRSQMLRCETGIDVRIPAAERVAIASFGISCSITFLTLSPFTSSNE